MRLCAGLSWLQQLVNKMTINAFPVQIFSLDTEYHYNGQQIRHLYWSKELGEEAIGNIIVYFIGSMDVSFENICDNTEHIHFENDAFHIRGPRLFHVIADFPQFSGGAQGLQSMYLAQNLLARLIFDYVKDNTDGEVRIEETDIFVGNKKLNVAICNADTLSTTMHFAINLSTEGEEEFLIPKDVSACAITDYVKKSENDIIDDLTELIKDWCDLINSIYLKIYKTRSH